MTYEELHRRVLPEALDLFRQTVETHLASTSHNRLFIESGIGTANPDDRAETGRCDLVLATKPRLARILTCDMEIPSGSLGVCCRKSGIGL